MWEKEVSLGTDLMGNDQLNGKCTQKRIWFKRILIRFKILIVLKSLSEKKNNFREFTRRRHSENLVVICVLVFCNKNENSLNWKVLKEINQYESWTTEFKTNKSCFEKCLSIENVKILLIKKSTFQLFKLKTFYYFR